MMSFSWEVSYIVNIEAMDRQHQKIFDCMAKIYSAMADNATHYNIDEMLENFDIFCKMHFYEEERLMEEMDYPSILGHKRQHDLFILDLDRFRLSDIQYHTHKVSHDFVMIKDWFINHILSEDLSYSEFYINKH